MFVWILLGDHDALASHFVDISGKFPTHELKKRELLRRMRPVPKLTDEVAGGMGAKMAAASAAAIKENAAIAAAAATLKGDTSAVDAIWDAAAAETDKLQSIVASSTSSTKRKSVHSAQKKKSRSQSPARA